MPRQLTDEELYQRHRQRKEDRQKLEVFKLDLDKNIDNPEYLELVNKYPKFTAKDIFNKMPERQEQQPEDDVLRKYRQVREVDKSNNVILELVPMPKKKKKMSKKIVKKKKLAKDEDGEDIEEFQPKMAGQTGLMFLLSHLMIIIIYLLSTL